jgi:hypothetical protein
MAEELCTHCGAPRVAGYAACKFCKTPFVANTQTNAIPCPRCNTLNEMGSQRCVQCQAWVVVQCVFCHALSPHNLSACAHCGEAFAGAPQRLQERQHQQTVQQGLQVAGSVGNVAASFLGAAAGAGMFSNHDHYAPHGGGHYHEGYYVREEPVYERRESSGGFFDSIFGGSSSPPADAPTGAGIAQGNASSGGGFFDSIFGGSSSGGNDDTSIAGSGDDTDHS